MGRSLRSGKVSRGFCEWKEIFWRGCGAGIFHHVGKCRRSRCRRGARCQQAKAICPHTMPIQTKRLRKAVPKRQRLSRQNQKNLLVLAMIGVRVAALRSATRRVAMRLPRQTMPEAHGQSAPQPHLPLIGAVFCHRTNCRRFPSITTRFPDGIHHQAWTTDETVQQRHRAIVQGVCS